MCKILWNRAHGELGPCVNWESMGIYQLSLLLETGIEGSPHKKAV